jgi:hypothetical protein
MRVTRCAGPRLFIRRRDLNPLAAAETVAIRVRTLVKANLINSEEAQKSPCRQGSIGDDATS